MWIDAGEEELVWIRDEQQEPPSGNRSGPIMEAFLPKAAQTIADQPDLPRVQDTLI